MHVAGATLVIIAVIRYYTSLSARPEIAEINVDGIADRTSTPADLAISVRA